MLPAEYGYIGVILLTAFTYTLLRLRFVLVVLITVVGCRVPPVRSGAISSTSAACSRRSI